MEVRGRLSPPAGVQRACALWGCGGAAPACLVRVHKAHRRATASAPDGDQIFVKPVANFDGGFLTKTSSTLLH